MIKRYGPSDGRVMLIRPDGYVRFKCTDEAGLLEQMLDRVHHLIERGVTSAPLFPIARAQRSKRHPAPVPIRVRPPAYGVHPKRSQTWQSDALP